MIEKHKETARAVYDAMSPLQRFMFLDRFNNPGPMTFREHVLFDGRHPTLLAKVLRSLCKVRQ